MFSIYLSKNENVIDCYGRTSTTVQCYNLDMLGTSLKENSNPISIFLPSLAASLDLR